MGHFYVALPAAKAGQRENHFSEITRRSRILDVHLVPCQPPTGTLEVAPRTSLREDTAHERWDGFWCVEDDRHYSRCTRSNGAQQWFRVAEERVRVRVWREARVLPLRRARMMIVGRYGRRAILVRSVR